MPSVDWLSMDIARIGFDPTSDWSLIKHVNRLIKSATGVNLGLFNCPFKGKLKFLFFDSSINDL